MNPVNAGISQGKVPKLTWEKRLSAGLSNRYGATSMNESSIEITCRQIMGELEGLGKESNRKTFVRHGAPKDALYGVAVADLKVIQKRLKKNHALALSLYETGNADAQYLAGLIADEAQMTKTDLNRWVKGASWSMISSYTVPWVAGESPHALALATKWIDRKDEMVAMSGWATFSSYLSVAPDEEVDKAFFESLLERVVRDIHEERNQVRDAMNHFVIALGSYVPDLTAKAIEAAKTIGEVQVDKGDTACKVPDAATYIQKVKDRGRIGKKRKSARC